MSLNAVRQAAAALARGRDPSAGRAHRGAARGWPAPTQQSGQIQSAEALAGTYENAARRFAALTGGQPVVRAARETASAYRALARGGAGQQQQRLGLGARRGARHRESAQPHARGGLTLTQLAQPVTPAALASLSLSVVWID